MKKTTSTPFQLSVSLHTLDPDQSLKTIKELAGSTVKSVEILESTFKNDGKDVGEARRAFAEADIEVRTVHARWGDEIDFSSLDESARLAGIENIRVALDLAQQLGAQIVVVHPSYEPISDDVRAGRIKQARRSIATLAEIVSQVGCQVAVELLPRTCLGNSAEELLELVEGVDPNSVGVCLDVNHLMNRFAALPEIVHTLAPRLIALHCSDYDGVDEKHWPPLRGVIDWAAFFSALRAINFSGPIHYETFLDGKTPTERLAFLQSNFAQLIALDG